MIYTPHPGNCTLQKRIRELLSRRPAGLTTIAIATDLNIRRTSAAAAIKKMPDTYICRWVWARTVWAAVWTLSIPPANAPQPIDPPNTAPMVRKISHSSLKKP